MERVFFFGGGTWDVQRAYLDTLGNLLVYVAAAKITQFPYCEETE